MRKLIVTEFVTIDGVMEAPGGEPEHPHNGWAMDYAEPHWYDDFHEIETLLLGRKTYESFAGSWPYQEGEFADQINAVAKVVVSNTLTEPKWNNTTVLSGDVVAGVAKLKEQDGGPILVGGSRRLVHALLETDLIDDLRLVVFPVTIGVGKRVFPDNGRKTTWTLAESLSYDSGIRVDTYER